MSIPGLNVTPQKLLITEAPGDDDVMDLDLGIYDGPIPWKLQFPNDSGRRPIRHVDDHFKVKPKIDIDAIVKDQVPIIDYSGKYAQGDALVRSYDQHLNSAEKELKWVQRAGGIALLAIAGGALGVNAIRTNAMQKFFGATLGVTIQAVEEVKTAGNDVFMKGDKVVFMEDDPPFLMDEGI